MISEKPFQQFRFRRALLLNLALVVLGGAILLRQPNYTCSVMPPRLETRTSDELPQESANILGRTDWLFRVKPNVDYDTVQSFRVGGRFLSVIRVKRMGVTTNLEVIVRLRKQDGDFIKRHELQHVAICLNSYGLAGEVSSRAAAIVNNQQFRGIGQTLEESQIQARDCAAATFSAICLKMLDGRTRFASSELDMLSQDGRGTIDPVSARVMAIRIANQKPLQSY